MEAENYHQIWSTIKFHVGNISLITASLLSMTMIQAHCQHSRSTWMEKTQWIGLPGAWTSLLLEQCGVTFTENVTSNIHKRALTVDQGWLETFAQHYNFVYRSLCAFMLSGFHQSRRPFSLIKKVDFWSSFVWNFKVLLNKNSVKQCRFCKRAPLQDETAELHNSSAKLQHLNCF